MITVWSVLLPLADSVPEDDDVVAGGWGALVFVALIVATALLCWSFVRQIRKVNAAKQAGVYGEESSAAPPNRGAGAGPAQSPTERDDVTYA